MREIKFRAKTILGIWIYGTPVYYASGELSVFEKGNDKGVGFSHYGAEATQISQARSGVNTKTLGQYTGLKDKNGKEIYEGDIVNACYLLSDSGNKYRKREVVFNDYAFRLKSEHSASELMTNYFIDEFEVIGNIHETPELL